ncbi:hypothetical protein ACGH7X_00090 [Streptomyces sp. BBFR51]|uniref:hypothetical protein n=1 Tax=Streptomyces sp. BBFR51 TaxID=3372856 RepID=UPI0037DDC634
MGCNCQKGNKTKWEVVVTNGDKEKVMYSSTSKPTAEAVGKRYPRSVLREVPPKRPLQKDA